MKQKQVSTPIRILIGLVLSIIGGLALVLAFPPYEIWPLALIGYIPVLVAQYRILPPKISSLAPAVGIAVWLQGYLVWPEGSFLWDPQVEDRLNLTELSRETNSFLAAGYVVLMDEGFRNEATVINPQGEFLGVFGKDHPVVFGGETSLTRGTYPVYQTPIGVLGTIICYDLDYTDTARKLARQGAQLVGVPSNDWGSIAEKHYTHVVFRAVENRVAMVKADGGFNSTIIDPYGRILALAAYPEGGEATLVADVPLGTGKGTLTSRLGDWMGWLALGGMAFFMFAGSWLEKRAR